MSRVAELQRENDALRARTKALETEKHVLETEKHILEERGEELVGKLDAKSLTIRTLEDKLAQILKRYYGPRSEKLDPSQLALTFLENSENDAQLPTPPFLDEALDAESPDEAPEESKKTGRKKPRRSGRLKPPADAPRERVVHEPDADDLKCLCCGDAKVQIGEEITEEVDYKPASMIVREHVRPKYACKGCPDEGVTIGNLPDRPIERGRPGPGLLAHIVASKYCDHMPLYRLTEAFRRDGWEIPRSTLCDWVRDTSFLLRPIVMAMQRTILESRIIQCDDTSIRMQKNSKRGGARKCHLWSYVGDQGDVVYDFTLTRAGEGPRRFLDGYSGYLQADAFSGFDELYRDGTVVEVGCWAHARRKFADAMDTDARNASMVLAMIQILYRAEREAKETALGLDELARLRAKKSAPVIKAIREWLDSMEDRPIRKDPLATAIQYVNNQWAALTRYLSDPRFAIDNNACERTMRRVALGRKNWMFTGSEDGGKRAAVLYSLVETCRNHDINTFEYIRDVLEKVSTYRTSQIDELTPRGWKAARAEQPVDAD